MVWKVCVRIRKRKQRRGAVKIQIYVYRMFKELEAQGLNNQNVYLFVYRNMDFYHSSAIPVFYPFYVCAFEPSW